MKRWLTFHDAAVEVHALKPKISKEEFVQALAERFHLKKEGKAWYAKDFAVSFAYSKGKGFSGTVVSLAKILMFDDRPFLVCLLRPAGVETFLANASLIKKVSHSSQHLALTNIRGSINGSDISREVDGLRNEPANFRSLYDNHVNVGWEDNLERIVAATNDISPTGKRFEAPDGSVRALWRAAQRSQEAEKCGRISEVEEILRRRLKKRTGVILRAAQCGTPKLRGDALEYLITGERVVHSLGDAVFEERGKVRVVVDVKTKVLGLSAQPRLYNVDKALKELAQTESVFCLFLVGIDRGTKRVEGRLVDILDSQLIAMTTVQFHWAGRNSRGATQLTGDTSKFFESGFTGRVDVRIAREFLERLLAA